MDPLNGVDRGEFHEPHTTGFLLFFSHIAVDEPSFETDERREQSYEPLVRALRAYVIMCRLGV